MENYYFMYKNASEDWHVATNPMFIAQHQHCRAIPKNVVNEDLGYDSISNLIYDMNYYDTGKKLTNKQIHILLEFDIVI